MMPQDKPKKKREVTAWEWRQRAKSAANRAITSTDAYVKRVMTRDAVSHNKTSREVRKRELARMRDARSAYRRGSGLGVINKYKKDR